MKCPRCHEQLKRKAIAEPGYQHVIDSCPQCRGIWLSRDQLNELEWIIEPAFIEIRDIPSPDEQLKPMKCPSCTSHPDMLKAEHERDKKVVLDYCPECKGIWLDLGELDAIQKENWLVTLGRIFRFISGADRLETLR